MQVKLVHYTGWPDFEAPADLSECALLIETIRSLVEESSKTSEFIGPVVVHCSAGLGRGMLSYVFFTKKNRFTQL